MKHISENIHKIIKKIFSRQHPLLPEIIVNWGKIVGFKFSHHSLPLKITTSKDKGQKINTLHVQTENSSISLEFAFQQEIIIERIAVYLGFKAIDKIKLTIQG